MLVLKRKKGQEIVIGDNISIVVSEIDSDSVELAIDALGRYPYLGERPMHR